MSQWDEQLSDHAIHASIENLADRLTDDSLVTEDLNVVEIIDRIKQAASYVESCLNNVIPALVNHSHLNKANSHISSIASELNSYISNSNVGHLNNTSAHIDNLMTQINALPIVKPAISEQSFTRSLVEFKSLAEKSFSEMKKEKDELVKSVEKMTETSISQQEKLDNLSKEIERFDQGISESLNNFNERFEEVENKYTSQLDSRLSEFNEQYDDYSEAFDSKIKESIDANQENISSVISEHKAQYEQQLKSQKEEANSVLEELEEKRAEASNLLQIIGNIGITGNYQNIANNEKSAADNWRRIALGLMVCMVLIIGITIFISASNGFDWKLAFFRVGAAFVLAIPAAYAAKESAKHRALENHNRRAELELASLDPYLEKLPEETRHKVKEELTKQFFGLNTPQQKGEEPVSNKAIFELLKSVIDKK
ncbi:hypothetical protein ALT761_01881 [Alteromonas sp. 76-1]|jgi:hypothetical protein|uniref:hypothetical protein n=1 Tax=Alteromonas sp. 76-1 TaxID=2358187 RepID=UPI000FD1639F|nr:hypothetical protein [Alteromonas sp. 76-1]VEL96888.1 hypothetical protein ALT761_01881 [Alteromonas sp. 76-1]